MKRFFAILVSISVLLSVGALIASAREGIFEPLGEAEIAWLTEEQVDSITFDGDLSEWMEFDIGYRTIDKSNLITWHVDNQSGRFDEPDAISDDFAINTYFAADPDYLYVAFFVVGDENWALADNLATYNGDAFQLSIDWNCRIEYALEYENADYGNNKNIIYSFASPGEGQPLSMFVQRAYKDRLISEADSENPDLPDMKGSTGAYEGGWCAEFCLSWELLYSDYEYKTWESGLDSFNAVSPLRLGITICYINRDTTDGGVVWAAATLDNDENYPGWLPSENGLYATLNWEEGRTINCSGIGNYIDPPPVDYSTASDTEEVVDVTETEATTTEVAASDTEAVTTVAVTETETLTAEIVTTEADTTQAADTTEAGCKSVVGTSGVLALVAVSAAGVVLRKKD